MASGHRSQPRRKKRFFFLFLGSNFMKLEMSWLPKNHLFLTNLLLFYFLLLYKMMVSTVGDPGGPEPSLPPIRPDSSLRLKLLHRQARISLFNWLMNFAIKLISRIFKIVIYCFWVPSYDPFASARKEVFAAPTATGVHRLRNTWSSLLSHLVE